MSMFVQKSQFLKEILLGDQDIFLYHTLHNNYLTCDKTTVKLLTLFDTPVDIEDMKKEKNLSSLFDTLLQKEFLVIAEKDERNNISTSALKAQFPNDGVSPITHLGLRLTTECNMTCTYCMSESLSVPSNCKYMSLELAMDAIRLFAEYQRTQNSKELQISFSGGEPLLRWKEMKEIMERTKNIYGNEFYIGFGLNTNGTLVTKEIAQDLQRFKVDINTSIDGDSCGNDLVRRFKNGRSAFSKIIEGYKLLFSHSDKERGIYTTLCDENIDMLDENYLRFCKDKMQLKFLHVEPDIVNLIERDAIEVADKLIWLESEALKHGIKLSSFVFRPFLNLIGDNLVGKKISWCIPASGNSVNVMPNGSINKCVYSIKDYGNYKSMVDTFNSDEWNNFTKKKILSRIPECYGCEIEGACMGGCFLTDEASELKRDTNIREYRCNVYKIATKKKIINWLGKTKAD